MPYNGNDMRRYNPKELEPKWQKIWEDKAIYQPDLSSDKPKYIGFGMFNYPSGAGIHVGHVRNYTIPDVVTRAKRQQGYESYQPVGWDSFGLPAENFAIKTGISPQESTKRAIAKYHKQYRAMGWAVDWAKEINTTDPEYYRWTQWIFTKLFEHKLAYQKESAQWWCEQCMTVLADEQVLAGKCWRHDGEDDPLVTKRSLKQWFFKITDYADEILEATDALDWTQSVKASQKAWIGRSEGAEITFDIEDSKDTIKAFTTRPDTLYGATFMVLAPEHPLALQLASGDAESEVQSYIKQTERKSEIERQEAKEKTGVFTGAYAINPINQAKMPIWVADYVLYGYGTGAIMAVPAHDERDFAFAQENNLDVIPVIEPSEQDALDIKLTLTQERDNSDKLSLSELAKISIDSIKNGQQYYSGQGKMINSDKYDGLSSDEAKQKIVDSLTDDTAQQKVTYKMRDWLISRQRYWGAPIPIIHCQSCGAVPVPEKDLPVVLPAVDKYQPTGGNASVLAEVSDWVNVDCPACGEPAKRETDTMDGYVCSSWYFLRYLSPHDNKDAWDASTAKKWFPADFYNGGDHATAHLLYARFFMRFFHKLGLVDTPEPFKRMVYNGKVKASDGSMFSKSKGNGVDPLEVIESGYGADALRLYEMFAAPVELDVLWDPQGIPGTYRFLNRVWSLVQSYIESDVSDAPTDAVKQLEVATHRMIKKVTDDIENEKFNTAIAAMMEALNTFYQVKDEHGVASSSEWQFALESLLQLLAPFAPHMAEELWQNLGHSDSIHVDHWPDYDEQKLVSDTMTIVVQVNGKVRANIDVASDADEESIIESAKQSDRILPYLEGATLKKTIYVPNKLVNFVV